MINEKDLCKKITTIYPDIGKCGIDVDVTFDKEKKVFTIDLKKDQHELKHYLEQADAESCLAGKQCVALGLEIAQLKKNITGEQF